MTLPTEPQRLYLEKVQANKIINAENGIENSQAPIFRRRYIVTASEPIK